jgi:hypothetical protein
LVKTDAYRDTHAKNVNGVKKYTSSVLKSTVGAMKAGRFCKERLAGKSGKAAVSAIVSRRLSIRSKFHYSFLFAWYF